MNAVDLKKDLLTELQKCRVVDEGSESYSHIWCKILSKILHP